MCNVCRSLFIFSRVRVTPSLVLCVMFVDRCLSLVEFVLLDLSFMCNVCRSLFIFSRVRVTPSLVLCVMFVDRCLSLVEFVLLDL